MKCGDKMSCINQAVATINSEIETVNSEPNSATRQIKLDLLEKIKARIEYVTRLKQKDPYDPRWIGLGMGV